eukprot:1933984-Rhodomonas_salina.1
MSAQETFQIPYLKDVYTAFDQVCSLPTLDRVSQERACVIRTSSAIERRSERGGRGWPVRKQQDQRERGRESGKVKGGTGGWSVTWHSEGRGNTAACTDGDRAWQLKVLDMCRTGYSIVDFTPGKRKM